MSFTQKLYLVSMEMGLQMYWKARLGSPCMAGGGTGCVCETRSFLTVIVVDLALQGPSAALVVVLGNFILGTALCFSISLDARPILNWLKFWKSLSLK